MLKYTDYDIVFQEIPDEVTLAINLSNCPNRCKGCHSPYLQQNVGEALTEENLSVLLQKYGISDHEYPDKKRLIGRLIPFKKIKINDFYFKLAPEFEEDRLYLKVYDENERFLESDAYINFSTIIERVKLKLNTLAAVYASKRIINTEQYFRYYKIIIYKLKTPEIFLDLIARNKITVSIIGRVSRSGTEEGRQRNKNLTFSTIS